MSERLLNFRTTLHMYPMIFQEMTIMLNFINEPILMPVAVALRRTIGQNRFHFFPNEFLVLVMD